MVLFLSPARAAGDHPTDPLRILIADDTPQVRRELRTVLPLAGEAAGLPVEIAAEAADGQEAVRLALALRPDAVLLDLEMPVLNGFDAARQIKAAFPGMRVVALTVHGDPAARSLAQEMGMDGFIVKGAPLAEILDAIQKPLVAEPRNLQSQSLRS